MIYKYVLIIKLITKFKYLSLYKPKIINNSINSIA